MNKLVSGITLIILVTSVLILTVNIKPVKAGTIAVPDDYSTIQEAINHASDGDTIFVRDGTYYENVVVNKTVSILGENENATVVDCKGAGTTVQVTGSNVTLSGFTIEGSGAGYTLSGLLSGIQVYRSSGNNISHNIVRDNCVGISLRESSENTLTDNIAYYNAYDFAVDVSGDGFSQFDNYVDTSNTVDGKSIYYLKDESNLVLGAQSNAGVVYLINCKNITVQDLTLTRNYCGVFLWNTTCSYITNVTARENWDSGIRLDQSENNTIIDNRLSNQEWSGVKLMGSENNSIMWNDASYNWNFGIYSFDSGHNQIASNILSHNNEGLYVIGSSDNTSILDNLVSNNSEAGATVYSFNCTLVENIFKENGVGIIASPYCDAIYHNNFIQNNMQVFPVDLGYTTWDDGYPSGGNYWSDYKGQDVFKGPYQNETGSDEIGDTPYVIGIANQDRYPQMKIIPIALAPIQYQITFDGTGVGSDFIGTIVAIDGLDYDASSLPVSFWWDNGSTHTFAFQSPLIVGSGAKEYDWASTTGLSTLQSDSITVSGAGSVTGNYVTRVHDVDVTGIVPVVPHCSSSMGNDLWVFQGLPVYVNVTVLNKGDFDENAIVTFYYNSTANNSAKGINSPIIPLSPGQAQTVVLVWNTTAIPYCLNYTITAIATIPLDNNPADNTLACGPINVRIIGDINGDDTVDGRDMTTVARSFGSYGPDCLYKGSAPSPTWNLDCDINGDNKVDGRDLTLVAKNFGK
jgi:parallel beta-helix repeat protein